MIGEKREGRREGQKERGEKMKGRGGRELKNPQTKSLSTALAIGVFCDSLELITAAM